MAQLMGNERKRLSRLLDDLGAERDPAERSALSPEEMKLAKLAVFLKGGNTMHVAPDEAFVRRLGTHLAAARQHGSQAPARPTGPSRHSTR
jgi:hypothetical protein